MFEKLYCEDVLETHAGTHIERRPGANATSVLHSQENLHPLALSYLILVMRLRVKNSLTRKHGWLTECVIG